MAHQCRADPFPLMLVDDGKSHLGCPRLSDNVTRASDDHGVAVRVHHGHQGDVVDEIDVHEECDFLLREAALGSKEAAKERPSAGASMRPARSSGWRARISTRRPLRNVSMTEYSAASNMTSNPPTIRMD